MPANARKPISLLLVDDHAMVRSGIKKFLARHRDITIAGESETVRDTIRLAGEIKPDVILLDLRLKDGDGLEACRNIHITHPDIKILILSAFAHESSIVDALRAGASGYVMKEIDSAALYRAIRNVAAGNSALDPTATRSLLAGIRAGEGDHAIDKLHRLSRQERRVMSLVASGNTNKEIGLAMKLKEKTVKNYMSNILEKLALTRRSQLAVLYTRHKYIIENQCGAVIDAAAVLSV